MPKGDKLTDKQEMFCKEYLVDLNATQAAIRAGYSEKTAKDIACENLAKPNLQQRIAELQAKRNERVLITADEVVRDIIEVKNRAMQKSPVMEFDPKQGCYVHKKDKDGNHIWQYESNSAVKALDMLGKHTGIYTKDNQQKAPKNLSEKPLEIIITRMDGKSTDQD